MGLVADAGGAWRGGNWRSGLPLLSLAAWMALAAAGLPLMAQTCTTQAKMTPEVRNGLADVSLGLATAVVGNDATKVQAMTIPEFATNFAPTADLVRSTSRRLAGDILRVTQVYELDATSRKAGDTTDAEFTCPLTGTTSETDFAIPGLPPGTYGFAMVEANGPSPWLLAFLLQQQGGQWKMAGFYPRTRTAAGHDGLWYWRAAREDAKTKDLWLAWLLYGEADQLLRPANFVTSTNLDLLQTERRTAVPPELSGGIGRETPLVVKAAGAGVAGGNESAAGANSAAGKNAAAGATEYRFTGISAEGSEDGKGLNLMLHLELQANADPAAPSPAAAKVRNTAAAQALLEAHRQLRQAFENVWVFAESPGQNTFATEIKMDEIR
jgi:hypothetical protein